MRTLVFCAVLGVLATRSARADELPDIKSRSAVVLDVSTGAEIFSKDADEIRPIASTTKIFVAMAVRKTLDLDGWTEITRIDAKFAIGGARTRLDIGQKFRNKDLLRAMLIASDNRAPTAVARGAGLDPDALVAAMNAVARGLKLKHTKFTDPTGLRGNVSTAREMAIALRAALQDDVLRAIMKQDSAEVVSKDHYARIHYGSTNQPLVIGKWDITGGKTGYTRPAGYCFITGARLGDREVVMAFLGSDGKLTRFGDFNRVATWLDRGALAVRLAAAKLGTGAKLAATKLAAAAAPARADAARADDDKLARAAAAKPAAEDKLARAAAGKPAAEDKLARAVAGKPAADDKLARSVAGKRPTRAASKLTAPRAVSTSSLGDASDEAGDDDGDEGELSEGADRSTSAASGAATRSRVAPHDH